MTQPVTVKKKDPIEEAKRLCDDWAVKKAATLTNCPKIGASGAQAKKYDEEEGQDWAEVLRDGDEMAERARRVDLALMRCFPGALWGAASRLLFLRHQGGDMGRRAIPVTTGGDLEKEKLLAAVFGSANRALHTLYKEVSK